MEYEVKHADRQLWTSKLFLEIRGAKERSHVTEVDSFVLARS
jgi:hypothetical protein